MRPRAIAAMLNPLAIAQSRSRACRSTGSLTHERLLHLTTVGHRTELLAGNQRRGPHRQAGYRAREKCLQDDPLLLCFEGLYGAHQQLRRPLGPWHAPSDIAPISRTIAPRRTSCVRVVRHGPAPRLRRFRRRERGGRRRAQAAGIHRPGQAVTSHRRRPNLEAGVRAVALRCRSRRAHSPRRGPRSEGARPCPPP